MNIATLILNDAEIYKDHTAIIDSSERVSYLELKNKINQTVNTLLKFGVSKNQGIAVLGENGTDFIVLCFAVIQIGAVVIPCPPHLSESELNEFVTVSQIHFICFNKNYPDYQSGLELKNNALSGAWTLWKNEACLQNIKYASHVSEPALMRFTSGTTGKSKGVILSHQTIYDRIDAANSVLKLNSNDKILWVLSMAFHFVVSIMLYLKNGCTIILSNNFLANSILNDINNYEATFLYASPMHIRLLGQDNSSLQIQTVRTVISTSTAISKEQCETFYQRYKIPVSQAYGIIEIGLPIINIEKSVEHPDAIGYTVPGYEIAIIDDSGKVLPDGEIGHLAINGPGMFDGYLSPPCLKKDVLKNGYFFTGDLAKKTPDGLISVEGRKKSVINVGGNKVFPEEVEATILQLKQINNCRVSGFKHPLLGESVMAEIELFPEVVKPDIEFIYQHCKHHLSSYKIPQKVVFVDKLILTKSGKVVRD